jgi:hypothetical protein
MAGATSYAEGAGDAAGKKIIEIDSTLSSLNNLEFGIQVTLWERKW